jgi:hypothetical protein
MRLVVEFREFVGGDPLWSPENRVGTGAYPYIDMYHYRKAGRLERLLIV